MPAIDLSYPGSPVSSNDPSRPAWEAHSVDPPVTGFMLSGSPGVLPLNGGTGYLGPDGETLVPGPSDCELYPFSSMSALIGAGPENTAKGLTGSSRMWPSYLKGEEIPFFFPVPEDGTFFRLVILDAFSSGTPLVSMDMPTSGTWILSAVETAAWARGCYRYIVYRVVPASVSDEGQFENASTETSGLFHLIDSDGLSGTAVPPTSSGTVNADITLEEGADWPGLIITLEDGNDAPDLSSDTFSALVRTGQDDGSASTLFELRVAIQSLVTATILVDCPKERLSNLPVTDGWWYLVWSRSNGQTLHPLRGNVHFTQS